MINTKLAPCENPFSLRPTSSVCFLNADYVHLVFLLATRDMTARTDARLLHHVDRTIQVLTLRGDWPRC